MKYLSNKEFKEILQSGHINLLMGSGCSMNYLDTLNDIEDRMNDESTRESSQKDYYKLIRRSKSILDESLESDSDKKIELSETKHNYDTFLRFWMESLSRRSFHIVNKQVNIFTTNFDMFIEDSCERLEASYNDGFLGQINPIFNVANFNRIEKYKSLQFDNTSDIPLFNIIKLHGSFSWKEVDEKICYSSGDHIIDDLDTKTWTDFENGYKKIAVINPNAEKHFETVLDINYASMLRKFTLELEKENSVLIVVWFSMADKHIRNLLYGVMKSNPTLIVIYFSYSQYDELNDKHNEAKNPNLYIISPIVNREKFEKIFWKWNEDQWSKYVKNKDAQEIEIIDDIRDKMNDLEDRDIKTKLEQVIYFPFSQVTSYLSEVLNFKKENHGE